MKSKRRNLNRILTLKIDGEIWKGTEREFRENNATDDFIEHLNLICEMKVGDTIRKKYGDEMFEVIRIA